MEEKVVITCDSAMDLSPELVKEYNIKVLPMVVKMGSEEYLDIEEVMPDDILDFHDKTGDLAVTAAPSMQQAFRFFTRFVHMGYTVIHFSMSSGMSASYANAVAAAESFERVHVIDSKTASVAGGLLVLTAAEMLRQGNTSEQIIQECKEIIPKLQEPFLIDEMEFLVKGGRASTLAGFMAGLFNIKPSLYVQQSDGTIQTGKKYRGKFEGSAPKFIRDSIEANRSMNRKHLIIGHTGLSSSFLENCKTEIQQLTDIDQIHIIRAGSTITSHLGKNALILTWISK